MQNHCTGFIWIAEKSTVKKKGTEKHYSLRPHIQIVTMQPKYHSKAHLDLGDWAACMTSKGAFKSKIPFFFQQKKSQRDKGPRPGATAFRYVHIAYMQIFQCSNLASMQINNKHNQCQDTGQGYSMIFFLPGVCHFHLTIHKLHQVMVNCNFATPVILD